MKATQPWLEKAAKAPFEKFGLYFLPIASHSLSYRSGKHRPSPVLAAELEN
jgi:hypothetical protein